MEKEKGFDSFGFTTESEGRGWVCSNCGTYNKKKVALCGSCNLSQAQATKRSLKEARESSHNFFKLPSKK